MMLEAVNLSIEKSEVYHLVNLRTTGRTNQIVGIALLESFISYFKLVICKNYYNPDKNKYIFHKTASNWHIYILYI